MGRWGYWPLPGSSHIWPRGSALRISEGYAYAIIGGVGPAEFYSKIVGATLIDNSVPGIYRDQIKDE